MSKNQILNGWQSQESQESEQSLIQSLSNLKTQTSEQYIYVKVVDQNSDEMRFRITKITILGKLMKAYSDRKGIALQSLRFLFDGKRIAIKDTPLDIDLDDEDMIEVYGSQVGGGGQPDPHVSHV